LLLLLLSLLFLVFPRTRGPNTGAVVVVDYGADDEGNGDIRCTPNGYGTSTGGLQAIHR
jgi:hypothetical protein